MQTHQSEVHENGGKAPADQHFFAGKDPMAGMQPTFFQPSVIQRKLDEAAHSPGAGLDGETKPALEAFLSAPLGQVQVHNNTASQEAAGLIQAKAYTTGNHIFLGREAGSLLPVQRQSLLTHEVVHTLQQRSLLSGAVQAKSIIGAPDTAHEKEADGIADAFTQARSAPYYSTGLQMRSDMRITPLTNPAIQRSVTTWGGTWDTSNYADAVDKNADGTAAPAASGVRGVDITLKFTPGAHANAELIGLTQSVQAYVNNVSTPTPAAATRKIATADAIPLNTGAGETDEGTAIDQSEYNRNPLYAVEGAPATDVNLHDTGAGATWGQMGWSGSTLVPPVKDATLIDTPRRSGAQKDSRHIFETAALAIKGSQAGTYYGSVRWGWRTDGAAHFSRLPLEVVSQGVPSATFLKAAQIWNAAKTSTGADTLDLPIVDVQVTNAPITEVVTPPSSLFSSVPPPSVSMPPRTIPTGTRVQIISYGASLSTGVEQLPRIKVVHGPLTGETLTISSADMAHIRDERA